MSPLDEVARRAALRASWPGTVTSLAAAAEAADLSTATTPEQRVAMVWELTLGAWAVSGRPLPEYTRAEMPGSVSVVKRRAS
jgi:hypothetical protein